MFTLPVLRYCKEYGVLIEKIANVAAIQREWAGKNPRAMFQITVDDVMNARMIAWPFTLLMCCLVTDGGGALIVTKSERAKDFPTNPVYILGTGESVETRMVSQLELHQLPRLRLFHEGFESSGIKHSDVDHLMIYDAFAHLPVWGLEDLGFCERGRRPRLHLGAEHRARRQAADEHVGRRTLLYAYGHVRHVRVAGEHPSNARYSTGSNRRCADRCLPRCRRHVCSRRYDRLHKPRSLGGPPPFPSPVSGEGTHSKTRPGSFRLDEGSQCRGEMRTNILRDGA